MRRAGNLLIAAAGSAVALLAALAIPEVRSTLLPSAEERFHPELPFTRIAVDRRRPTQVFGKGVGDLDGDGDPDLIAGGWEAGGLLWYENPSWTRHQIADGIEFSSDIAVCDVDRDGDLDVVSLLGRSIAWYANPAWLAHVIAEDLASDLEVADLDGDGDCDLAARGQTEYSNTGHLLLLYEQRTPATWARRVVAVPRGEGLTVADLDRDGDVDLVLNQRWLENTPRHDWPQHAVTTTWTHDDALVETGDMDGDGDVDLVLAPSELQGERSRVSWFEAPADPRQPGWVEHVVADSVEAVVHSAIPADIDGDGDLDLVTAEMRQGAGPHRIMVNVNVDGRGTRWSMRVIGVGGSHNMRAADVDADGDLDLFGGNFNGTGVHLFRNDRPRSLARVTPQPRPR